MWEKILLKGKTSKHAIKLIEEVMDSELNSWSRGSSLFGSPPYGLKVVGPNTATQRGHCPGSQTKTQEDSSAICS